MTAFEASPASKNLLQRLLARGGAFLAEYEFWGEGKKTRFFVVANWSPATDEKIILFSSTTQIVKRRTHHGARADLVLVSLDPRTYDGVVEPCVLDCESPVKRRRSDFVKHVEEGLCLQSAR